MKLVSDLTVQGCMRDSAKATKRGKTELEIECECKVPGKEKAVCKHDWHKGTSIGNIVVVRVQRGVYGQDMGEVVKFNKG